MVDNAAQRARRARSEDPAPGRSQHHRNRHLESAGSGPRRFLHMVGYDRKDLVSGRARWTDMTPAEWRDRDALAVDELKRTGIAKPFEKEYLRKDGSRVP